MKKDWTHLKILHLSTNPIGVEGVKILAAGKWDSL